jgi:rare lipoprotein A
MHRKFIPLGVIFLSVFLTGTLLAQETGIAEVYSSELKGKQTSSGSFYNPNLYTAAHKMHAMGTQLKVTRTDENARRWVIVTVTDRGPFVSGHIVALSKAAGERLGMDERSTATVIVEAISSGYSNQAAAKKTAAPAPAAPKVNTPPSGNTAGTSVGIANVRTPGSSAAAPGSEFTEKSPQAAAKAKTQEMPLARQGIQNYGLYSIPIQKPEKRGYGVQIMVLSSAETMLDQVAALQKKWFDEKILVGIVPTASGDGRLYKIILGVFDTEQSAKVYEANLRKKFKIDGFVVSLENFY